MRRCLALRCLGVVSLVVVFVAGCRKRHDDVSPILASESDARRGDAGTTAPSRSQLLAKGSAPIAVGPSSVVFMGHPSGGATANRLLEVSKDGGTPALRTTVHFPRGFALDERGLYFLDEGPTGLFAIATGSDVRLTLAGSSDYQRYYINEDFIVARAGYVYWSSGRTSTHEPGIVRMRASGGAVSLIVTSPGQLGGLAVDDAHVYVTGDAGVISVPIGGGKQSTLSAAEHGMGMIAVNATHAYWWSFDRSANEVDLVWYLNRVSIGGGAKEVLLRDDSSSQHLFALGLRAIYWVNEHELHRADVDGRNDTFIEAADARAIAADEANVYFTNGNEVRRLAQ